MSCANRVHFLDHATPRSTTVSAPYAAACLRSHLGIRPLLSSRSTGSINAIRANAEFLEEPQLAADERTEMLAGISQEVLGMTELIDSFLLFARTGQALQLRNGEFAAVVERAVAGVKKHPDVRRVFN